MVVIGFFDQSKTECRLQANPKRGVTERESHQQPLKPSLRLATMMHLLGIDHERLTYKFQGRRYRLTDVHSKLVSGIV